MSIPDSSLGEWYALLLGEPVAAGVEPMDAKRALARRLVERFHSAQAAREAEAAFDRVHVRHELPEEIESISWERGSGEIHLPTLLAGVFGISSSDGRRALAQGGVKLDGAVVDEGRLELPAVELDGKVLQLGKRRFKRVRVV